MIIISIFSIVSIFSTILSSKLPGSGPIFPA